ncbi:uncharacterized protein [Rhodnius prolixus]|uniref:Putative nadh:ubiquinone oxidoreductase n=1 Tax=Rhodnius prolixus TaxID=13249 RepID=R4FMV0_RHOPR
MSLKSANGQSDSGGVKVFSIEGRLYRERERLQGMTEQERAWRCKWVRDQRLAPDEPKEVPELYKELRNPFRRAYRLPLDLLFEQLKPYLGCETAAFARAATGKFLMGCAAIYCTAYYFKYNGNDWTKKGGWRVITSRKRYVEGDVEYLAPPQRVVGADYASSGFKNSPI